MTDVQRSCLDACVPLGGEEVCVVVLFVQWISHQPSA